MNRKIIGALVAVSLLIGSCAKDSAPEIEDGSIKFNGTISNLQATTIWGNATSWADGDDIGIFMVDNVADTVVEGNVNKRYTYSNLKFVANVNQLYPMFYPVSDTKVGFIAYYPYKNGTTLTSGVPINVSNQTNLADLHVLYVKSTNGGNGYSKTTSSTKNVDLPFNHKMSKIYLTLLNGTGLTVNKEWNEMEVTIKGMNTISRLDLSDGTLATPSTPANIVPYTHARGLNYEAIVLPGTYATAGAVTIEFKIGGDTYVWTSPAGLDFESGKQYNYTLTINKTNVALGSVSIVPWVEVSRTGVAN